MSESEPTTSKVQYIRKYKRKVVRPVVVEEDGEKKKVLRKVTNPIFKKNANEKLGVMFADVYGDDILIGFSVCHSKLDKFDHVRETVIVIDKDGKETRVPALKRRPGFGVNVAKDRAEKWRGVQHPNEIPIPQIVEKPLVEFLQKCERRYSGKNLVPWAKSFVEMHTEKAI